MRKLLIIDDDDSVRKVLRSRLRDSYEIFDIGSAEDALTLALRHKPDAILLDLMMPRYSGSEVCQTLSSLSFTQHIPILIVSGEASERYREFCENIGAKGFFEKPVDFDALEKRLAELIALSHQGPRPEPRVRLRVMLTLKGIDSTQKEFDLMTATENVGSTGFLRGYPATLADVGSRTGDGQAQGLHGSHGRQGLLLRSAKSLAARHERKHQSAAATILPPTHRPVCLFASAARPGRAALESTTEKDLRIPDPCE